MKRYETIFISKVNQSEEDLAAQIAKFEGILIKEKGFHIGTKRWGQRRLAYQIDKQSLGYYVLIDWAGDSPLVAELERNLKNDDRILKYLTVRTKDRVTKDEVEAEIAALIFAKASPTPAEDGRAKLIESPPDPQSPDEAEQKLSPDTAEVEQ